MFLVRERCHLTKATARWQPKRGNIFQPGNFSCWFLGELQCIQSPCLGAAFLFQALTFSSSSFFAVFKAPQSFDVENVNCCNKALDLCILEMPPHVRGKGLSSRILDSPVHRQKKEKLPLLLSYYNLSHFVGHVQHTPTEEHWIAEIPHHLPRLHALATLNCLSEQRKRKSNEL